MWESFTAEIYSKNYFFAGKDIVCIVCIIELKVDTVKDCYLLNINRELQKYNETAVNCGIDTLQSITFQNIFLVDSSSCDEGATIHVME